MPKFQKLKKIFVDKPVFTKANPNNPVQYIMKDSTNKSPTLNSDEIQDIQKSWDDQVATKRKTLAERFNSSPQENSDKEHIVMNHGLAGNFAFKDQSAHELFDKLINAQSDDIRMNYINDTKDAVDEDDALAIDEYLSEIGSNVKIASKN